MFRVFGRYVSTATLILGIAEAATVCALIYAGAAIFSGGVVYPTADLDLRVALIAIAVVLVMHSMGLYDEDALTNLRQSLLKLAFIIGPIFLLAVVTTGILAKNKVVPIYPYRWQWTIGLTTLWFASVLGGRLFFTHLHENGKFARRIALLGGVHLLAQLRELVDSHRGSIRIVAQFDTPDLVETNDQPLQNLALLRRAQIANAHEILVDQTTLSQLPVAALIRCRTAGFPIIEFPHLFERETGRVDLGSIEPQALLLCQGLTKGLVFESLKRCMDVAMALLGLVLFAPVMIAAALALRLEGSGPIFYRQERIGRDGKAFMILKFRSMRTDAEQSGVPRWASESDPRITPVGRIIRKVRIDELPQFLNVLRGDMSVVGPRPERPYFVSELAERLPYYQERHLVRPGITGWAQVNFRYGASLEDAARKHSYDLYYLKHRSLLLDLMILLKTVRIVLFAEGAW